MNPHHFRLRADLSEIVETRKIIASSIGPNGEACLLLVAPEFEKEPFGREERKGFASFPFSKSRKHYPATFVRFDGGVLQQTQLHEVDIAFPSVQPLPNGEILLVGARCHYRNGDPEKNAVVFGQGGESNRHFVLGDGINDVQTTGDGAIWVSYFDEGVMGNYGWDKPMGATGLVCFDAAGRLAWEFQPPPGVDPMVDCYALNVAADSVWACYYSDFPLVKIDSNGHVRVWKNKVSGANALAVSGRRVVLWGGYGDQHSQCVLQDIGSSDLNNPVELEVGFPSNINPMSTRVLGRGTVLNAFVGTSWFAFDLEDFG